MTSDPHRQAALAAESDPTLLGSALAAVRRRYAWNRHDLARWLNLSLEQLDALYLEPLQALPMSARACEALARRYAADVRRLTLALVHDPVRTGGAW